MFISFLVVIAVVGIAVPPSEAATKAPAEPKECKFPFVYNGESYWMCSNPDYDPRGPWCSTETDDKNNYITGKYKYCDEAQECKFPFIFNGVTYWKCSNPDSDPGGPWCSTETDSMNNYITRKYKYCDAQEEGRMAEVGNGIFPEPKGYQPKRPYSSMRMSGFNSVLTPQGRMENYLLDLFPEPKEGISTREYRCAGPEGRCGYGCPYGAYNFRKCPTGQRCCVLDRTDIVP